MKWKFGINKSITSKYNQCSRCVLDTTVTDIWFDENNECKYCKIHDAMESAHPLNENSNAILQKLIGKIKKEGRQKKYDCIVGVSGGRDSTYTLLIAKNLGLRPLAVHFDSGWNSDISVRNIKNACEKLKIELFTIVADWEEFKDLQNAFLKSSTPDADIPADYAIYSVLYYVANKENVRFILNGHSFRTEGTSPISWTYMDPLYVSTVHKKFGKLKRIRSFPHMSLIKLQYYIFIKRIREIRLMEYIEYNKEKVDSILKEILGWEYYGGHHHENLYTRFFQSYYLPKKFGIDKRKIEYSALIRSGQITKLDAITKLESFPYQFEEELVKYTQNKLGITTFEWNSILNQPIKSHEDYTTLLPLIKLLKYPIKIAVKLRLLPVILYLKYAK